MNKAESLRQDAATLDREAARCRRMAAALARKGCCFTAGDMSERAVEHARMAAKLRLDAYEHDPDGDEDGDDELWVRFPTIGRDR